MANYKFQRVDKNQNEIVKRFRDLGCHVFITSGVGHGFPDLFVRIERVPELLPNRPWCGLIEVKDGKKPPSQQKLTEDEIKFHEIFEGCVYIITSLAEVDRLVERAKNGCQ